MSKAVTFYLGPAANLDSRTVRVRDVGQVPPDLITEQALAGSATTFDLTLPDNGLYEIQLTDKRGGVDGVPRLLRFTTNESILAFVSGEATPLSILSAEDTSSSSSSNSSSSSSTSSLSETLSVTSLSSSSSSSSSSSTSSLTESSNSSSSQSSSSPSRAQRT